MSYYFHSRWIVELFWPLLPWRRGASIRKSHHKHQQMDDPFQRLPLSWRLSAPVFVQRVLQLPQKLRQSFQLNKTHSVRYKSAFSIPSNWLWWHRKMDCKNGNVGVCSIGCIRLRNGVFRILQDSAHAQDGGNRNFWRGGRTFSNVQK